MKSILIIVIALCLTTSCKKLGLCDDDDLSIIQHDYLGAELKVDGYYYEYITNNPEDFTTVVFLYQNGVCLGSNGYDVLTARSGDIDVEKIDSALKSKAAWGVYNIVGNTIEIEHWAFCSTGCFNTLYELGEIKNDTTFVITKREYREDGSVRKSETPNSTFYFRPLEQKPDSTNNYINSLTYGL